MTGLDRYAKYRQIDCTLLAGFMTLMVAGLMVSWQIPLFTPLFLLYLVYFFATRRVFSFPRSLWPILVIASFYLLGLVMSKTFYYRTKADLVNIVIGLAFGFAVWNVAQTVDTVKLLLKKVYAYIFYTVVLISILGIIKLDYTFRGGEIAMLWQNDIYPFGTNLITNYNNTALACLVGLTSGVALIRYSTNVKVNVLNMLLSLPIMFNLIASGSRRTIPLLVLGLLIVIPVIIVFLFKDGLITNMAQKLPLYMMIFFLLSTVVPWTFIGKMKPEQRMSLVQKLPYDVHSFTKETTKIAFRYHTLVEHNANIKDFYRAFWGREYYEDTDETPSAYGGRLERYQYAYELFVGYSLGKKLFGNGFDYIGQYTEKFLKPVGKSTDDYPHNFYLSGVLYSGILGLAALLWFTGYLFYKLVRIIRRMPELGIMVILAWFNILFSYNSIFSLRLFIILVVLVLVVEKRFNKANESSITGS